MRSNRNQNGGGGGENVTSSSSSSTNNWRRSLPAPMISKDNVSIWSVLKQSVGKDLTRITIPIVFNEPLSFLQRLAEYMEYGELLRKADQCDDEIERFENVSAFIISTFAFNHLRLSKPFNPLWFETFELDRTEDEGYRFVAEQVSHHPPISAFHVEAESCYEFYGTVSPKLRFWGSTIEVLPCGNFVLKLLRHNETFTWNSINVSVHNIIMGQMYMNLVGRLDIKSNSGKIFKINFKPGNGGSPIQNAFFEGRLCSSGKTLRVAYGNWTTLFATCDDDEKLFEQNYTKWLQSNKNTFDEQISTNAISTTIPLISGSKLLWQLRPRPLNSKQIYNFTSFTLLLNDPDGVKSYLPRTDSRLRPDIRLLEKGQFDEAAKEKERLEVKQREARAINKKLRIQKQPKWFDAAQKSSTSNGPLWIFNKRYWCRRDYESCEDIF